jgi:hypothetical protein
LNFQITVLQQQVQQHQQQQQQSSSKAVSFGTPKTLFFEDPKLDMKNASAAAARPALSVKTNL